MRHTRQRSLNSWLKAAATLCLLAAVAQACSVPVFRYALERWQADPYEVFVFHHGKLTATQQAQVDRLTRDGEAGKTFANVRVKACDLDNNPDPDLLALWKNQNPNQKTGQETSQKITTPWMAVHYPVASRNPTPVWQGPLTDARVTALLKSPMRKTIADRLIQGHTSVFVLLESGNQAADDKAATLILARLAHLETNLKLPEISEEDIAQGLVLIDPEDLKVKFSLLRLSRKNAAETMFIEMLLSSEDDLREDTPQPMAFPIFGRGRALYALVGKGINNDTIDAAGADLTGPCTCTVKEQNPGIDMLMPVAWDQLVQRLPEADRALPPLVGLTGFDEEPQDNNTDDLQNTGIQTTGETTQQTATISDDSNNSTDSKTDSKPDSKPDPQQHPEDSTTETSSGSTDNVGFLAMVTGLALVGIWLFVKRRV